MPWCAPHYVRMGLLWPFVGGEIGCWLRRHRLVEEALGERRDRRNNLMTLRIAVGAPYDALLVLCPFLCLHGADATHMVTTAAAHTAKYQDPFLEWLPLFLFLLSVLLLTILLFLFAAKLYQKTKKMKEVKDATTQCTLPLEVIYIAPNTGTCFHIRKRCVAHHAKEIRELRPCKLCCP